MYTGPAFSLSLCILHLVAIGLVSPQSFSFGIGFDSAPAPSSPSFAFNTPFSSQRSRTESRGASRKASGGASESGPATQRDTKKTTRQSVSSFVFSGLDDESQTPAQTPVTTSRNRSQTQRQRQQQAVTTRRQQSQQQAVPRRREQQKQQNTQTQRQQDQRQTSRQQQPQPKSQSQSFPKLQRQRQTSTPSIQENEITDVTIGKSPCARGLVGQACRMHLKTTAMTCTSAASGKCFQCQQCGTVPANESISCCRDHFLCCRPLARSCQRCDQPLLEPFCKTAFGRC